MWFALLNTESTCISIHERRDFDDGEWTSEGCLVSDGMSGDL